MRSAYLREHGRNSLELIEEAFHLVRNAKPATWAAYYLGTTPFIMALLIFWSDMSRSPFAFEHLSGAALILAVLFLWMKLCQTAFARLLHAELRGSARTQESWQASFRSLAAQALLQSSGLFVLPAAALVLLPFGWVYAFYQNVTALDDGKTECKPLFRKACQQAALWPGQNHFLLLALSGFGLYVFLNWLSFCLFAPQLLKMFFDIETPFSQSPASMLNTTLLATLAGLTYLCLDPLVKACYVLRCFYGSSLRSGEDIQAELRQLTRAAGPAVVALVLCLAPERGQAADPPAPVSQAPPAASLSAPQLNRSIDDVTSQVKYTWRMPREKLVQKDGPITQFLKSTLKMLREWPRAIKKFLERLFREKKPSNDSPEEAAWTVSRQGLLFLVLGAAACTLAIIVLRILLRRKQSTRPVQSEALQPLPDLEDESLSADQLPEDDWTRLGRELLDRGELRPALRAFYLASLANLAARDLVRLTRSKSNRDYERELQRRGRSLPGLPETFGENVSAFERAWYGLHEVNGEILARFIANLEKIKATA